MINILAKDARLHIDTDTGLTTLIGRVASIHALVKQFNPLGLPADICKIENRLESANQMFINLLRAQQSPSKSPRSGVVPPKQKELQRLLLAVNKTYLTYLQAAESSKPAHALAARRPGCTIKKTIAEFTRLTVGAGGSADAGGPIALTAQPKGKGKQPVEPSKVPAEERDKQMGSGSGAKGLTLDEVDQEVFTYLLKLGHEKMAGTAGTDCPSIKDLSTRLALLENHLRTPCTSHTNHIITPVDLGASATGKGDVQKLLIRFDAIEHRLSYIESGELYASALASDRDRDLEAMREEVMDVTRQGMEALRVALREESSVKLAMEVAKSKGESDAVHGEAVADLREDVQILTWTADVHKGEMDALKLAHETELAIARERAEMLEQRLDEQGRVIADLLDRLSKQTHDAAEAAGEQLTASRGGEAHRITSDGTPHYHSPTDDVPYTPAGNPHALSEAEARAVRAIDHHAEQHLLWLDLKADKLDYVMLAFENRHPALVDPHTFPVTPLPTSLHGAQPAASTTPSSLFYHPETHQAAAVGQAAQNGAEGVAAQQVSLSSGNADQSASEKRAQAVAGSEVQVGGMGLGAEFSDQAGVVAGTETVKTEEVQAETQRVSAKISGASKGKAKVELKSEDGKTAAGEKKQHPAKSSKINKGPKWMSSSARGPRINGLGGWEDEDDEDDWC